jgi:hypothetical protein
VKNSAPVVYGITLNFGLNDTAYQTRYVTFSKTVYTINQGETELEAWLTVLNSAPAAHLTLTVNLNRDQRVPDDTTVSNASLTMLLFGGGARWAAGNGTSALYVNWFDNYNIHYFTDSAKWNTTWWPREDLEKMKQNTITELSCRDFNVECVGDIPPDISKYDLVIFEAWWAVEPRHSQLVREYLINGGNVVVLQGVPSYFSVYCKDWWPYRFGGLDLSSLMDWFGSNRFANTGGSAHTVVEHPFGTALKNEDVLISGVGGSCYSVVQSSLSRDCHVVALWDDGLVLLSHMNMVKGAFTIKLLLEFAC